MTASFKTAMIILVTILQLLVSSLNGKPTEPSPHLTSRPTRRVFGDINASNAIVLTGSTFSFVATDSLTSSLPPSSLSISTHGSNRTSCPGPFVLSLATHGPNTSDCGSSGSILWGPSTIISEIPNSETLPGSFPIHSSVTALAGPNRDTVSSSHTIIPDVVGSIQTTQERSTSALPLVYTTTTYLVASTRGTQPSLISQPSAEASNVLPAEIGKEPPGIATVLVPVSPNPGVPAAGTRTSPKTVALTETFLITTSESPGLHGFQTLPKGQSEKPNEFDSVHSIQIITALPYLPSHDTTQAITATDPSLIATGTADKPGTVIVVTPSTDDATTSDIVITSIFITLPSSSSVPIKSKEWTLTSDGTTYTAIISGFPSSTSSESSTTEVGLATVTGYPTATGGNRTTETNHTLGSSASMTQTFTVTESASASTSTLTTAESTRAKGRASEKNGSLCFLLAGLLLSMFPLFRS